MKRFYLSLLMFCLMLQIAVCQWDTPEDFAHRRSRLMEEIKDGVGVVLGAEVPDAYLRFRQNNHFYYMTGVEVPEAILLLNPAKKESYLFVPDEVDPEIKPEARISPGADAEKKTRMERVYSRSKFTEILSSLLSRTKVLYTPFGPEELLAMPRHRAVSNQRKRMNDPWDLRVGREVNFTNLVRERFPEAIVKNLDPFIDEMRWVKDEKEIAVLRRCVEIGVKGMVEAIKATRPGMYQYELEAVCNYNFQKAGAIFPAYYAIVASGEDGLASHYNANNHRMNDGEAVLIDYAPEYEYMSSDLNRTWPVGREFTPDQRKMYDCVLEAAKEAIKAIKPGVTYSDLSAVMKRVYEKHGFGDKYKGYVGHFVGMAVHDVGSYDKPFVPGVVFNVEPLLEDKDKKIHIRLEDTVLVTKDGSENLSKNMPWEVEELYKLRRGN